MPTLHDAERLLQLHFGYRRLRPSQRPVIASVLKGRDALAVLPTGGGKSVCFQIPALLLEGFTVVVSPLIALMQDQVSAAGARGIPAVAFDSTLAADARAAALTALQRRELPLVYTSPEGIVRLGAELAARGLAPALLAVDEAHCIAEWGHDFRPAYRALRAARLRLGSPPCLALTGSATPPVRREIIANLGLTGAFGAGSAPDVHLGSFDRSNLRFEVVRVRDDAGRLRALAELLRSDVMAIIYAPTRKLTEAIARALTHRGHRAAAYHAGLEPPLRRRLLRAFLDDEVDAIVATSAFGMGIDKPTVRLVVHWSLPPTLESYYQEAGRAGRDGRPARCVLLYRPGDGELHRRQLAVTFPSPRLAARIWADARQARTVPRNVLESIERLRLELAPERGVADWTGVRKRRRVADERIRAVERYAGGGRCRRWVLLDHFGERLARCGGCDRCDRRAAWWRRLLPSGGVASGSQPHPERESGSVDALLRRWRRTRARQGGVPDGDILSDEALRWIAEVRPATRAALGLGPGIGPRALAKWGDELTTLGRLGE